MRANGLNIDTTTPFPTHPGPLGDKKEAFPFVVDAATPPRETTVKDYIKGDASTGGTEANKVQTKIKSFLDSEIKTIQDSRTKEIEDLIKEINQLKGQLAEVQKAALKINAQTIHLKDKYDSCYMLIGNMYMFC